RSTDFDAGNMRVFLWEGTTYTWSLSSLDNYQFGDISTAVPDEAEELAPVLVYPNPSDGAVYIGFTVSGSSEVDVHVMDLRGGLVRTVHRGQLPEGRHTLEWDGRDAHSQPAAAGTYLIRVVQGPRT
ncbi:MAG: FlgD immunoglobulin-like domain containing protein, partial [Flavobacteriales bacterium]